MLFSRFVIQEGRVASRRTLEPSEFDPALLRTASEVLNRLQDGAEFVSTPLPDGPELVVRLGLPAVPIPGGLTEEQRAAVEAGKAQHARLLRRSSFHLEAGGQPEIFFLVRADTQEEDPSLHGLIAGTWGAVHAGEWVRDREAFPMEQLQEQFRATAQEIVRARPAVVCSREASEAWTQFADCFAAAMLSSD